MDRRLGKIEKVSFGLGGYNSSMLGISFTLGNGSWGVGDFKGYWDAQQIEWSKHAKWTEEDRSKSYDETLRYISKLLKEAKVDSVDALKNKPIEATFDGNILKEWRILTEVL